MVSCNRLCYSLPANSYQLRALELGQIWTVDLPSIKYSHILYSVSKIKDNLKLWRKIVRIRTRSAFGSGGSGEQRIRCAWTGLVQHLSIGE